MAPAPNGVATPGPGGGGRDRAAALTPIDRNPPHRCTRLAGGGLLVLVWQCLRCVG